MNPATDRLQRALGAQYRILRELGGGGMSHVYLAEETSLGRQVVVKVLSPELASDAGVARFKQEAAVTAQLQHPNIVPVLAFGARDGLLYYVTPFVAGETLRHRLEREGALPMAEALRLAGELAEALAVAHAAGVVHRDIKPENIFLSNGHAVLADFGVARALHMGGGSPGTRLTAVGTSLGTPGYMSPEQAAGGEDVDARSDIYSLAVVVYEMLAGVPPFTGETPRAVLAAHLSQDPKPVTSHRREVPGTVSAALARALAKDPADRFATAAEFRDALHAAPATATPGRRPIALALAIVVILAAGAAWILTQRAGATPLDANLVAIAPFDVLDPSLAMWKEGIVDILSANLDGAGPLKTVSPTTVIRRWSGRADAASAAALGRTLRARYIIYGRFVGSGADSVRATATIYDVAARRSLGDIQIRDVTTRLDRVADSLTIGILRQVNESRPIAAVRTATIGSSSLPAIKAYLRGEQFYRRSEWDSAAVYYRAAVQADSMFAPALRKLSAALAWTAPTDRAQLQEQYSYALLAGQRNHGLAPRESLLVAADSLFGALQAHAGREGPELFGLVRRLFTTLHEGVRQFPDDPGIWYRLGDARYHWLTMAPDNRDNSYAASRHAFDHAISLDSAFTPSYVHMPELALWAQDADGAARYSRAYLALQTSGAQAEFMRALLLFLDAKSPAAEPADSLMRHMSYEAMGDLEFSLMAWMDSAESQVALSRALPVYVHTSPDPRAARVQARGALVLTLATRGHLAEAAALLDSASLNNSFVPQMVLLGAIPADSANRLLHVLARRDNFPLVAATLPWWAERGDTSTLQHLATRFDTLNDAAIAAWYLSSYRASVHAFLDLSRRDTTAALRDFAAVPDSLCAFDGCTVAWYTKARVLEAVHRDRDAMRVLQNEYTTPDPGLVLWHLERARVAERLGDANGARSDYAFVAAAWQHADSSLQTAVTEAHAALKRLGGDGARPSGG